MKIEVKFNEDYNQQSERSGSKIIIFEVASALGHWYRILFFFRFRVNCKKKYEVNSDLLRR